MEVSIVQVHHYDEITELINVRPPEMQRKSLKVVVRHVVGHHVETVHVVPQVKHVAHQVCVEITPQIAHLNN